MSVETDMQAAEYVLGTLSAEERRAFEALLTSDASARRALEVWQQRLAPLSATIGEVEPPARVWQAIEHALSTSSEAAPVILMLRRSRDRWRMAAVFAGALAAGLVAFGIDRVLVAPQEPQGSYVAVVNRSGNQPALIIRVDLATRTVFVRPVAAVVPKGRSLELWYIGDGMAPKSMGLVDKAERNMPLPEGARVEKANFAVTVEPEGGAPHGVATGPVVYSGQLLKE
jgi:anti-sigma-K factor RskA